ncbi:MAG TPA: hypothetical protein VFW45_06670 [Candidatus Polarisedimenticolia bacterium]|nr:hypothetical protein [Candidatus Polarisedimenticolia bacterium]
MRRAAGLIQVGLVLTAALGLAGAPQAASKDSVVPVSAYGEMRWRLAGPFRGGWATVAAGVPGDPATWYFGSADGGVWKSNNAGVTWTPIFNQMGSASIGALALAPSDPRVIWVGTGQVHQRYDIVDGDGVYRSTDGGATWSHVGLSATRHIGAIWVDPRDAGVAIVAALGHVFGPNPERGLYRTTDGGKSWVHVLDRGPEVGAVDLAGDPALPEILFASLWEVRRHPWLDYFQPPMGPGSGIFRSVDGGKTWSKAGSRGLPAGPLGRIELAVSPLTRARRVWAAIHAQKGGGLYRSEDAGNTWSYVNSDTSLASAYCNNLTADPRDPEVVWAMGRSMRVSRNGGKEFRYAKGSPGGDDYHFLWIDPTDPRRMITAADQGAVLTLNGGESWSSWYNQPTGQFYRLAVDDQFPYWIYSGQQDSGTVGIASRSDYGQLTFRDWHPVGGDERDGDVPDPAHPGIVYGAGLGGRLSRWDSETGQVKNVAPRPVSSYGARPGTARYRYPWITPMTVSPRPPHAIYVGSQVLFRSLDSGQSWETVSPDLSDAPKDAKCEGDVPVARATRCGFGTIFAISPSPLADGIVWAGTDNGRVWVTRDDSKSWKNVTPPGLQDWTRVSQIDASPSDPATAYVAADGHRRDDFRPIAYRTHDYGAHWEEIGHGLPASAWLGVLRQDPRRSGLLFAGTSRGVWASFDDGESWQTLQLNLPTTGINDLRVVGDDLVAATQGRALWILDQLAPLRDTASPVDSVRLVPPGETYRLRGNQNKDTPLPPEEPRGENPPDGAIIDYVLPDGISGPVSLEILDAQGKTVRRFSSADPPEKVEADVYFTDLYLRGAGRLQSTPGHHRFVWNLRYERPSAAEYEYSIAAVAGRETDALPAGAFVLPGTYRIRLDAGGSTIEQPLRVTMDPRVQVSQEDLGNLLEFQLRMGQAMSRSAILEKERAQAVRLLEAGQKDPAAVSLRKSIERQKEQIDKLAEAREEKPASANADLATLATDLENADAAPTSSQREMLAVYEKGIAAFEKKWKAFTAGPYADLSARLVKLGIKPKPVDP